MRKLALLSLISYITILLMPFAFAVKVTDPEIIKKDCKAVYGIDGNDPEAVKEFDKSMSSLFDPNYCGEANPFSNSLEKGDCTLGGQSITEITEPLTPGFKLSDKDKVVDVYAGICCLTSSESEYIQDPDNENYVIPVCTETRRVYFAASSNDSGDGSLGCIENAAHCERRQWIIASSGTGLISVFVKQAYIWGTGFVGLSAVIAIVWSGIQISVSGVSGDITQAKERIIQAISGLVLLFLSGLILYTINPTFFT